jgi:hypothetical protein
METLYLLVETEVGRLEDVLKRVRQIPHVVEVEAVTGPFDLIVKIQAGHVNEALDIVLHRVRRVPGIKGTETLVAVNTPGWTAVDGPPATGNVGRFPDGPIGALNMFESPRPAPSLHSQRPPEGIVTWRSPGIVELEAPGADSFGPHCKVLIWPPGGGWSFWNDQFSWTALGFVLTTRTLRFDPSELPPASSKSPGIGTESEQPSRRDGNSGRNWE